jgi:hypothetical protein
MHRSIMALSISAGLAWEPSDFSVIPDMPNGLSGLPRLLQNIGQ